MRVVLAELAPRPGEYAANAARVGAVLSSVRADLVVFPELFLSGYRIGDQFHRRAVEGTRVALPQIAQAARSAPTAVVVGAPTSSAERAGEIQNSAILVGPDPEPFVQGKRYLPTYGPFEEGSLFTPVHHSETHPLAGHPVGLQICYDAFFPEVSRELAHRGAELLVVISAAPVTSRRLFEKVLPARAVENASPVVYVNRVGVEDGIVFGGGSAAWDARGERLPETVVPVEKTVEEDRVVAVEIDLTEAARWRPFRPVLRDVSTHPPTHAP
jgi:predicted amidohydrolase